jgi:hypothetical protein
MKRDTATGRDTLNTNTLTTMADAATEKPSYGRKLVKATEPINLFRIFKLQFMNPQATNDMGPATVYRPLQCATTTRTQATYRRRIHCTGVT